MILLFESIIRILALYLWGFFNIHSFDVFEDFKKLKGDSLETLKIFGKSLTKPKKRGKSQEEGS